MQDAPSADPPPPMEPVHPEERHTIIDVLRGVALFGILAANMRGFAGPEAAYFNAPAFWKDPTDLFAQKLIDTFIQSKFITIFAFLFGAGFAVQFARAESRGTDFQRWYPRRLWSLMLIGLAHQALFWWGDILVAYSIVGFWMIPFRKRLNRTILIWALVLSFWPGLLAGVGSIAGAIGERFQKRPVADATTQAEQKSERERKRDEEIRDVVKTYQSGTWIEMARTRVKELRTSYVFMPFYLPLLLGTFLLGMLAWRAGILQNPEAHRARIEAGLWIGAVAGAGGSVLLQYAFSVNEDITGVPTLKQAALSLVRSVITPLHSLFYVCAIVLLFLKPMGRRLLTPFAAVGRTALSSYLLQTIVCTTLFYSYGGGLFGKYGPAWLLLPTVVIYGLQIPLANWWLTRYRFGPMEWVWRSMTYGKRQPMRREAIATS